MTLTNCTETAARVHAAQRLQSAYRARLLRLGVAALVGGERRTARFAGLFGALVVGIAAGRLPVVEHGRLWAQAVDDEARNAVQAWLLTGAELGDWQERLLSA